MKPRVYIARGLPEEVLQYLEEHCEVRQWQGTQAITNSQLATELGDSEGLLVTGTPVGDEVLAAGKELRVISNLSVGYNNLDIDALKRYGITASHTPYVLDDTVADLAFA